MDDSSDGLVWNIPRLLKEIKEGIKRAFSIEKNIVSLAIDTWGVDYVLMNGDKEIPPYYAYRNSRNNISSKEVHKIIPFSELYQITGIQFAPFNTIYQLYDDLQKGRLEKATDYLMLPSYFSYKLTGIKTHEYTDESTGAFLNIKSKTYDFEMLEKLGLPQKLFKDIQEPGYFVGELLPEVQKEVGGNCKVILCASHDTGSAFEAIKLPEDAVLISSGTWSLLGIKTVTPVVNEKSLEANYTNEGGVNYYRFLKNIMGMWVANKLKDQTGLQHSYIDSNIKYSKYDKTFDINDPSLLAPNDMKAAVLNLLKNEKEQPKNIVDIFASIYCSLAVSYKHAIEELERITGKEYKYIYIIGGGAKNKFLNHQVTLYTGKTVRALPIEATCLGNIKIQMKASGEL